MFLLATNAQTAPRAQAAEYSTGARSSFPPVVKRPSRQADHSLQSAVRKGQLEGLPQLGMVRVILLILLHTFRISGETTSIFTFTFVAIY
jgi:hypothetical protein